MRSGRGQGKGLDGVPLASARQTAPQGAKAPAQGAYTVRPCLGIPIGLADDARPHLALSPALHSKPATHA